MSETAAAILILPTLAALVLVLECSRLGCTHLSRRWAKPRAATAQQTSEAYDPSPLPDQIVNY